MYDVFEWECKDVHWNFGTFIIDGMMVDVNYYDPKYKPEIMRLLEIPSLNYVV